MAYYAYKTVRDLIPNSFRDEWIKKETERFTEFEYEGDPNYDGDMWYLTAAYIEHLESRIEELLAVHNIGPKACVP